MFFVVDKPRLQRLIALTRDDRRPKQQGQGAPFFRIEASGGRLRLAGRQVEAEFPATIYEEGVLFLRVTTFRQILGMLTDMKTLAIQVNKDGLFMDNVRLSLEVGDMLLYADPATAPRVHPLERLAPTDRPPSKPEKPPGGWGPLFEQRKRDGKE